MKVDLTNSRLTSGQKLGLALMQWHASGSDPIYRVGSCMFAEKAHELFVKDVDDACYNLRYCCYNSRQAKNLATQLENWFCELV